jgi:hypothetical protein
MKGVGRLNHALRFWQSRYDSLALELDVLVAHHQALNDQREHRRRTLAERRQRAVHIKETHGTSLLALHSQLVAHNQHEERAATQQQALRTQIEVKRSEMMTLRRKLRQVEIIKTASERAQINAQQRRIDEQAAYLHLIRNRVE